MISLQIRQLQRQLLLMIENVSNAEFKQIAKSMINSIFGPRSLEPDTTKKSFLEVLFNTLEQDPQLGEIYSKAFSKLTTEELSELTLFKVYALVIFCDAILKSYTSSKTDVIKALQEGLVPILDKEKVQLVKEELESIPKAQNSNVISLEGILDYILAHAKEDMDKISVISTWPQILQYVYGSEMVSQQESIAPPELITIKEFLLHHNLEGELIKDLYRRYDGIVSFCMSILTFISGTEHYDKFAPALNHLLEGLITFSRIKLIQQKIQKIMDQRQHILGEFHAIQELLFKWIELHPYEFSSADLNPFFNRFSQPYPFKLQFESIPTLEQLPEMNRILTNTTDSTLKTLITEIWEAFRHNVEDLSQILSELRDFLNSLINQANSIIGSLIKLGFQANLPLYDIDRCEQVGIHLRELANTGIMIKTQISPQTLALKDQLLIRVQTMWEVIHKILKQKAAEEEVLNIPDPSLKVFSRLYANFSNLVEEFAYNHVFDGFPEEAILQCRFLASLIPIFKAMLETLKIIESIPFDLQNMPRFLVIINQLSEQFLIIKKIGNIALLLNEITKKLTYLNRSLINRIGDDPMVLNQSDLLKKLLMEIPNVLKTMVNSKIITPIIEKIRLTEYAEIMNSMEKLTLLPEKERILIMKFQDLRQESK